MDTSDTAQTKKYGLISTKIAAAMEPRTKKKIAHHYTHYHISMKETLNYIIIE